MKIVVIKNKGQYNHLIWRCLRELNIDAELLDNRIEPKNIDTDGIVIAGGPYSVYAAINDFEKMGNCRKIIEYAYENEIPLLGICLGLQAIAYIFGGKVGKGEKAEYGETIVYIEKENDILKGLGNKLRVWASHKDEVKEVPKDFERLAYSDICQVEAMGHKAKPIYGVQWHPEVVHSEKGKELFMNFIEICKS